MRAAKWNTDCESGGVWQRKLVRRGPDGPMIIAGPCRFVVWEVLSDGTTLGSKVVDIPGTVAGDGLSVVLRLDEAATLALTPATYRHMLSVTDPEIDGAVVLARGAFTVYGNASDL